MRGLGVPGSINSKLVVRKDQENLSSLTHSGKFSEIQSPSFKNWSLPPATLGGLMTPPAPAQMCPS